MPSPSNGLRISVDIEALWRIASALDQAANQLRIAGRDVIELPGAVSHSGFRSVNFECEDLKTLVEVSARNYDRAEADAERNARAEFGSTMWGIGNWERDVFLNLGIPAAAKPALMLFPFIPFAWSAGDAYLRGDRTRLAKLVQRITGSLHDFESGISGRRPRRVRGNGIAPFARTADSFARMSQVIKRGDCLAKFPQLQPCLSLLVTPDTDVAVTRVSTSTVSAPPDIAALLDRIPEGSAGIRIEKYTAGGTARWIVYIEGTAFGDSDPSQTRDMQSNFGALADQPNAAQTAVERAMKHAGIRGGDQVMLVGHSQGGRVAANIAGTGAFHVVECVTIGAPLEAVSSRVPMLVLQNDGDLIPETAGGVVPASNVTAVNLTPRDLPAMNPLNPQTVLEPHNKQYYVGAAPQVEASFRPEVKTHVRRIHAFSTGQGQVMFYSAKRN